MEEKKILIDNLKINYKIAGSGPAILILHGWGSNSEKWQKVGDLLVKKGLKVIIPDLPGFGSSQKPPEVWGLDDYCKFLQEFVGFLNLEKFCLLGHSFGGALAVKYALAFSEKIDKLFLISAACFRRRAPRKRLFYIIAKVLKIFSFFPYYLYIRKGFYRFIVRKSDYLYADGVMKNIYLKIIREDLGNILEQIQVPTIIIWGREDKIKRLKEARLINEKVKNSKLEIIPNIGHSPHLETPEKLVRAIFKHLKE